MSDAAFKVFDSNGVEILNLGMSPGRVIGSVDTSTSNGSVNVPEFGTVGIPWFICMQTGSGMVPSVSISGTTLSWAFPASNAYAGPVACIIIYGVR